MILHNPRWVLMAIAKASFIHPASINEDGVWDVFEEDPLL